MTDTRETNSIQFKIFENQKVNETPFPWRCSISATRISKLPPRTKPVAPSLRPPSRPRVRASGRLEDLIFLGRGLVLSGWVRRHAEGRALAALVPVTNALADPLRHPRWPASHSWGERGAGPGQLDCPLGVCVSLGGAAGAVETVLVCDTQNHRVSSFRMDGTWLGHVGSGRGTAPGQLSFPTAVATVAATGDVVVCDRGHRIQVFDSAGTLLRTWGRLGPANGEFNYPAGVAVHDGDDGLVFVSDTDSHRIQCFRLADGAWVQSWGRGGKSPGQFMRPHGLAVSSSPNAARGPVELFVCDRFNHRVQVFGLDGTFLRLLGGENMFDEPHSVACCARSGEVLVADRSNVHVFDQDGTPVRYLALPPFAWPGGVAITPAGDVLVTDQAAACVVVQPAGA